MVDIIFSMNHNQQQTLQLKISLSVKEGIVSEGNLPLLICAPLPSQEARRHQNQDSC